MRNYACDVHIGYWVKEYTPAQRGFDTFYGYYSGAEDYWNHSNWQNGYWGLDLHQDTPQSSKVSDVVCFLNLIPYV